MDYEKELTEFVARIQEDEVSNYVLQVLLSRVTEPDFLEQLKHCCVMVATNLLERATEAESLMKLRGKL
jgi:hypothetical protein